MRLGEAIAHQLATRGVSTVFGIPGVHTIEMYRGLPAAGIASVPARHEQGVGFMADAYARQSGEVGVALLVTGPGLFNALTPLAQAWHDSVPLLYLAADTATSLSGRERGPLHDVHDQVRAAAGATAHSWRLNAAEDLSGLLDAAWYALRAPRPRPVVISIPIDLLEQEVPESLAHLAPIAPPATPAPENGQIERASAIIADASQPVIIAGGGARGAQDEVRRLAELIDAPVITTGNGSGILPPEHPLAVGTLLPLAGGHALVRDADVVIAVGTEFSDADMLYSGRAVEVTGRLVRIDTDPVNLGAPIPADAAVCADAAEALSRIAEALPQPDRANSAGGAVRTATARDASDWTEQSEQHMPWIDAIMRAVPAGTVQVLDSTQLAYTLHQVVTPHEPTERIAPYGLGTLGPALPMGIGAAVADPDRPVLVIAGDGGVLFTLPELAGAVELGRQFTLLIWDNRGYGEIRDSFDRAGAERRDTEVTAHDHAAIARGFGAEAVTVSDPQGLELELHAAMRRDSATVIVAQGF